MLFRHSFDNSMVGLSGKNPIKPISDESLQAIIDIMENILILSDSFKLQLRHVLFEISYKKGSNILNAGARQANVWFVLDGVLQEISVDKYTFTTTTTWFWFKTHFVYAMPGFFDQEPSHVTINVVKDCKVVLIRYEDWKALKDTFHEVDRLTEMIRSNYEMSRKVHLNEINTLSTVDRYLKHESEIDLLLTCIQLKYIAAFMGMSTDTLGKLRRRLIRHKQPLA